MKDKTPRKKAGSAPLKKSVAVSCHPRHLGAVRELVFKMWHSARLPLKKGRLAVLAVDEALSAIIRHARGMKRPGEIEVNIEINPACFKATIRDHTNIMDLNHLSDQETKYTLQQERSYQLGLFLIATIMDEVSYTYKKGFENELKLVYFI